MAEVTKKGIVVNPSTGSGDTTLKVKAQTPNSGNRVKQSAKSAIKHISSEVISPGATPARFKLIVTMR